MPDTRKHRGPHPADADLFSAAQYPRLQRAVEEFSWLLTREYATTSALKLVGDRHGLTERQRLAVMRASCSDPARGDRRNRELDAQDLRGTTVEIDGFNLLTTIEAALGGGVILACRDGCFRDMASMHGSYRKVRETRPALELTGEILEQLAVGRCDWYFDSPVSNSGRICGVVREIAAAHGWNWQAEVHTNPDSLLISTENVVVSADSHVLDYCGGWLNLARRIITDGTPDAKIVPLEDDGC